MFLLLFESCCQIFFFPASAVADPYVFLLVMDFSFPSVLLLHPSLISLKCRLFSHARRGHIPTFFFFWFTLTFFYPFPIKVAANLASPVWGIEPSSLLLVCTMFHVLDPFFFLGPTGQFLRIPSPLTPPPTNISLSVLLFRDLFSVRVSATARFVKETLALSNCTRGLPYVSCSCPLFSAAFFDKDWCHVTSTSAPFLWEPDFRLPPRVFLFPLIFLTSPPGSAGPYPPSPTSTSIFFCTARPFSPGRPPPPRTGDNPLGIP